MDINNSLDQAKEGTDEFLLSCDYYDYYLHYDSKNVTISITAQVKDPASLEDNNDIEKEKETNALKVSSITVTKAMLTTQ